MYLFRSDLTFTPHFFLYEFKTCSEAKQAVYRVVDAQIYLIFFTIEVS